MNKNADHVKIKKQNLRKAIQIDLAFVELL